MQLDEFNNMDKAAQWQTILSLSANMMELARDANWEKLQEMDTFRRQALESFFAVQPDGELAEQVKQDSYQILQADQAIVELVKAARDIIPQQMNKLNQGRKAAAAYSENS